VQVTGLTEFAEGVRDPQTRSLTSEQVSVDAANLRAAIVELGGSVAGSPGLSELLALVSADLP
jgi:hypothetical protein